VKTKRIDDVARERIIRGKDNWWFLGPGGVARLYPKHLTSEGALTPSAERHLRDNGLFTGKKAPSYTLTVLTSTDCNLGCGYCFQNTGQDSSGGNRPPRIAHARLTSGTITRILEFASRQMSAADFERLHIVLFGGEPLLNPRGCTELLARAADYGLVSAAMISNATLLTPALARELVNLKLTSVQVSFDGDHTQHDLIRVRRSGGGTFDSIVENMARVSETVSIRWLLRVNVSHHNSAGIDGLIDALAARLDTSQCHIHFAWVDDVGVGYENEMRPSAKLAQQFFGWHRRAIEAGFAIARPSAQIPCVTCSFDNGQFGAVVSADGSLSSCWETAGRPGWQVGSVVGGYLPAEHAQNRWVSCMDTLLRDVDADLETRAFKNTLDAALLDYLDETGRL